MRDVIEAMPTRIFMTRVQKDIGSTPMTKKAAMTEIAMYASKPIISFGTRKILLYLLVKTVSQPLPIGQTGFSEATLFRIRYTVSLIPMAANVKSNANEVMSGRWELNPV